MYERWDGEKVTNKVHVETSHTAADLVPVPAHEMAPVRRVVTGPSPGQITSRRGDYYPGGRYGNNNSARACCFARRDTY